MRPNVKVFVQFLRDNRGAVTVDYVILAAAATMLALASYDVVRGGMQGLAGTVDSELRNEPIEDLVGTTYADGFDNGSGGWAGAFASAVAGIGNVLGPIGGTNGQPRVTRDFYTDPNAQEATFNFDLYAMDSLDNESGIVFIDGVEVGRVTSNLGRSTFSAASNLAERGIIIRSTAIDDYVDLGGSERWRDSLTNLRITVANPSDRITFGFGSTANQEVGDESFAIDNFTATGLRNNQPN